MPRLSIGMPVYNGEAYLAAALDSLLSQTFGDFELLICDNASTDSTGEIARRYTKQDSRVRYLRHPENIGAAANFNLAFERTGPTELFKWAAADDLWQPTYLARCIEKLDAEPEAVLAHSGTQVIDEHGEVIETYDRWIDTDSPRAVWRYRVLLGGHRCYEVFGVIRRDVLRRTGLIGNYSHGDNVLLARLALRGPFAKVPDPLFLARRHERQSMAMVGDWTEYAVWFDPKHRGRRVFPRWRRTWEYLRSIPSAPIDMIDRLHCLRYLMRHCWRVRGILAGEIAGAFRRRPRAAGGTRQATGGRGTRV